MIYNNDTPKGNKYILIQYFRRGDLPSCRLWSKSSLLYISRLNKIMHKKSARTDVVDSTPLI